MFDKIKFEFEGEEIELNARRMPHSVKGRLFDQLVKSRTDGIPSTQTMQENRVEFICSTYVDDAGKPIFKRKFPADETTWADESVQRQYPELWPLGKFIKYAAEAEKYQSPKLEDVAKNSSATTNGDSSSESQ